MEHILLTVDGAVFARPALEYVARLANRHQSRVTVVRAYKPAPSSAFSAYFLAPGSDRASRSARALLEQTIEDLQRMGVENVKGELKIGTPREVLKEASKSLNPDLIVTGEWGDSFQARANLSAVESVDSHREPASVFNRRSEGEQHQAGAQA